MESKKRANVPRNAQVQTEPKKIVLPNRLKTQQEEEMLRSNRLTRRMNSETCSITKENPSPKMPTKLMSLDMQVLNGNSRCNHASAEMAAQDEITQPA